MLPNWLWRIPIHFILLHDLHDFYALDSEDTRSLLALVLSALDFIFFFGWGFWVD